MTHTCLNFLPNGEGTLQLFFTGVRKTKPALSPIFATPLGDPAFAGHDGDGASQTGAIHCEDLSQSSLGDFSCVRKSLQDGHLRRAEAEGTEFLLVELGEGAGRSPKIRAEAGQNRKCGMFHADSRCIYI